MAKDAAAVAVLRRELDGISGSSTNASRGLDRAESSARRFESTSRNGNGFSKATSELDDFVKKLGILPAVAIAGTAALTPLAAAAVGVTAALAAPITFVGGGLTLFGLLDGAAIKKTNDQLKNIDTLKTKLAGLKKGTDDYTKTAKQLAQAQKALTPAQRDYASSLDHVKAAFSDFLNGPAGSQLLEPVAQALNIAADLLPKAEPIIKAVSGDLSELLGEFAKFSETKEFSDFVHEIARQIGPDLLAFGHIAGDIGPGIGHLLEMFGRRLSPELLGQLQSISSNFADWASSKGARQDVKSFIQYLHETGPQVAETIKAIADGMAHFVHAVAPLGPPILKGIENAANAIADIPTTQLTELTAAMVGLTGFSKLGGFKALGLLGDVKGGGLKGGVAGLVGSAKPVPVFVTNPGFGGGSGGPGGLFGKVKGASGETGVLEGSGPLGLFGKVAAGATLGGALLVGGDQLSRAEGKSPLIALPGILGAAVEVMRASNKILSSKSFGIPLTENPTKLGPNPIGDGRGPALPTPASLKSTGSSIDAVNAKLAKASQGFDLIGHSAAANSASAKTALKGVSDELSHIPDAKKVNLTLAGASQAIAEARQVAAEINALHDKTIRLTTERTTGGHSVAGNADGGPISGPGGPRDDLIPAWLSNGEYVVNAASVARYGRDMFDQLNAGAYANGGSVDAHHNLNKPLFTHEGPHWYKAAYKHGRKFAKDGPSHWDWPYQTGFSTQKEERQFERWVNRKNVPFNMDAKIVDYDMRGYWKKTKGRGWHQGSHFPDTFKTPYDTTFSAESKYATKNNPFHWRGNKLIDARNGQVIFANTGGMVSGNRLRKGFANGGSTSGGSGGPTPLKTHTHALADDTKALSDHQSQLHSLMSAEKQMTQTVAQSLQSSLFAQQTIWGSGGSVGATLKSDLSKARQFNQALREAARKGASGGLLAEAAQSGNLQGVQQFAHESPAQVRRAQQLYRERQRLTTGIGRFASTERYGDKITEVRDEVRSEKAEVAKVRREIAALRKEQKANAKRTGEAVAQGVTHGVRTGVRRATK